MPSGALAGGEGEGEEEPPTRAAAREVAFGDAVALEARGPESKLAAEERDSRFQCSGRNGMR